MKIYIDWNGETWDTEEEKILKELADSGELSTYSDFLADEYADRYDELLNLSEKEKSDLYERYEMSLKLEFEEKVKRGQLNYTVLDIETKDIIEVKEIL